MAAMTVIFFHMAPISSQTRSQKKKAVGKQWLPDRRYINGYSSLADGDCARRAGSIQVGLHDDRLRGRGRRLGRPDQRDRVDAATRVGEGRGGRRERDPRAGEI